MKASKTSSGVLPRHVCGKFALKPRFHILIAEDDLLSQKILEKNIIMHGHEVTCVENGREALKAFDHRFSR